MKSYVSLFNLCLFALTVSACGALKVREKDETAVKGVKRVAIVAFMAQQPGSATIGLNLSKGQVEGGSNASGFAKSATHTEQMFIDLANQLKKNLGWSIPDRKVMTANPGYTKAFKQTMEGWQNKMPPGKGMNQFLISEVMDADGPRILGPQGRDELIEALKVDGILVVRITTHLKGTSVMGLGNRYPQSLVSIQLFSKGKETPIWFDGQIEGEESKQSVGKTAFIDEQLLNDLAVSSAKSAFSKIGTN